MGLLEQGRNTRIWELIDTILQALEEYAGLQEEEKRLILSDVTGAIRAINKKMLGYEHMEQNGCIFPMDEEKNNNWDVDWCYEWLDMAEKQLRELDACRTIVDEEFCKLMGAAMYVPEGDLAVEAKRGLNRQNPEVRFAIESYYNMNYWFWGTLSSRTRDYVAVYNRIGILKKHRTDFTWLYQRLEDYRSKKTLNAFLKHWLSFDTEGLVNTKERLFEEYFDFDILDLKPGEVIVDAGAYTGDTVVALERNCFGYRRIYAFEASSASYRELLENVKEHENVTCIHKALGDNQETLWFSNKNEDMGNHIIDDASDNSVEKEQVQVVCLDEEIKEPVTLIKMDIEGAEYVAIKGCKRHIREEHPKMIVCVYHNNEDIFRVARLIHGYDDTYRFYLRKWGSTAVPVDYVLYAV